MSHIAFVWDVICEWSTRQTQRPASVISTSGRSPGVHDDDVMYGHQGLDAAHAQRSHNSKAIGLSYQQIMQDRLQFVENSPVAL